MLDLTDSSSRMAILATRAFVDTLISFENGGSHTEGNRQGDACLGQTGEASKLFANSVGKDGGAFVIHECGNKGLFSLLADVHFRQKEVQIRQDPALEEAAGLPRPLLLEFH